MKKEFIRLIWCAGKIEALNIILRRRLNRKIKRQDELTDRTTIIISNSLSENIKSFNKMIK